jgi:hypothetical protein
LSVTFTVPFNGLRKTSGSLPLAVVAGAPDAGGAVVDGVAAATVDSTDTAAAGAVVSADVSGAEASPLDTLNSAEPSERPVNAKYAMTATVTTSRTARRRRAAKSGVVSGMVRRH